MQNKHLRNRVSLLCFLSLLIWACDSSSDGAASSVSTGGTAGQGGTGGGGAAGGAVNVDSGVGLDASQNQGGQGGSGGNAAIDGSGGAGGDGGADSMGPLVLPDNYQLCQERCEADSDCLENFTCTDGVCGQSCSTNRDCIATYSAWVDSCQSNNDCPGGMNDTQACIQFDGLSVCAIRPNDFLSCETMTMVERELNLADGSGVASVCIQDRASCDNAGTCTVPCSDDSHCLGDYPSCDVDTGRCTCTAESCQTNGTLCAEDGFCRCRDDSECTTGPVDVCIDGFCGCSGDAVCESSQTAHPGTILVCERP